MADLYLGKLFDPKTKSLGDRFLVDPADFTTHGIVIGMTGSGKTGLSLVIVEEMLKAGIPVIAVDPKGDVTNLALAFDRLAPEQFEPWVDREAASQEGKTPGQAAGGAAEAWSKGLGEWGISAADVAGYAAGREVRIITPGSSSGIPLNLVDSLEAPAGLTAEADEEEFHEQVDAVVTALLGLVGIEADPVQSREYVYLFSIIDSAWRQGQTLSLEALVGQVATPPMEKLGALPVDVVFPAADRRKLMLALNSLLASPPFQAWRQGEPKDIGGWLRTPDGRPRATIVYTAHLDEQQRIFVTSLLLNRVKGWMRAQPGTSELRCLLYIDEIFGYFPPTENPPTKKPLLTLLKQARAFGVGVLLATQNPVDLDYRGLSNMGFWAIGRLQTTQDQRRVREGIEAALADAQLGVSFSDLLGGVQKRVFLVHDIHRRAPALVHSRWAMSYLRGPLTREEIERFAQPRPAPRAVSAASARTSSAAAARPVAPVSAAPPLPAPLRSAWVNQHGGTMARPFLFVKAAVRYKSGSVTGEEAVHQMAFPLSIGSTPSALLEATPVPMDEESLSDNAPAGLSYGDLPAWVMVDGAKPNERALAARLDDRLAAELLYDPRTKMLSRFGEEEGAFAIRVRGSPVSETKRRSLEQKLEKARVALANKKQEKSGRRLEKWGSVLTGVLGNINIVTGRKRTVSGVGGVLSKQRMESAASSRVEQLEEQVRQLEAELGETGEVDPGRFERRQVKPARADVSVIRYAVAWVY